MSITDSTIKELGDELYAAWRDCRTVSPLTDRLPDLTIAEAYRIQLHTIGRRVAAGETHLGKKVGLTARVVQKLFGVHQPDFGHLLSGMSYSDGATLPAKNFIQPKGEGEIGFVLKKDLMG